MAKTGVSAVADDVNGNLEDANYAEFLDRLNVEFQERTAGGIFKTNADPEAMWNAYLSSFPPENRQFHNCNCCKRFIQSYGGLVVISEDGRTSPAIQPPEGSPAAEQSAIEAVAKIVRKAKVVGVFLSSEAMLGNPTTGLWRHLHVKLGRTILLKNKAISDSQAMAEKVEDFRNVSRAIGDFSRSSIEQAVGLLRTESLYRSEKVLGQAEWLMSLYDARDAAKKGLKENVVWRHIAAAPAGFCHPRSSMIGTLLEDIQSGMAFDDASRRFAAKMHPLQYQRPQAAPKAGNIEAAEKLVDNLGIRRSLERRFARLDECSCIWKPKEKSPEANGGVFGKLRLPRHQSEAMTVPSKTMTWMKFSQEVLPNAESIEVKVPHSGPFTSFVTAVHYDAPPILQWDSDDARNPVSWYFYNGGCSAASYGLSNGEWAIVSAVSLKPSMWVGDFEHQGKGVCFIVEGAADERDPGLCLFPEILKNELRAIRATIEAYCATEKIQGKEQASAAGLMYTPGGQWGPTVRVKVRNQSFEYTLDRWD